MGPVGTSTAVKPAGVQGCLGAGVCLCQGVAVCSGKPSLPADSCSVFLYLTFSSLFGGVGGGGKGWSQAICIEPCRAL